MKARLITRCGCERTINIPSPPPREWCIPLKPREPNEGVVRHWLRDDGTQYDYARDGLHVRKFRVSLESLEAWHRHPTCEIYDPAGYDVDRRTYSPKFRPSSPGAPGSA